MDGASMETATVSSPTTTCQTSMYRLNTEQFGDLLIEERYMFTFHNGLLGFEELRHFIVIRDERTEPVRWLLSIEHPELSFPVMSPYLLMPDYSAGKAYSDTSRYTPLVILTLGSSGATANLKAPVILDVQQQCGEQIIISSDKYSTAHPIGVQQPAL